MDSEATYEKLPIFVYGTLMPGQPNDFIWRESIRAVEPAHTDSCSLFDFIFYPVMVEEAGPGAQGQLIWVVDEQYEQILQAIDFLEGFKPGNPQESLFSRKRLPVRTEAGDNVVAWAYLGHEERVQGHRLIESGDWVKYIAGDEG